MDEELLERLRRLMQQRSDVTATPTVPVQPTIGPQTGTRVPPKQRGVLAAIQRSAAESPDTPAGWANEMLNPVRAGAQAREFVGQAGRALRRADIGRAVGAGALAAMSVPGVPGKQQAGRAAMSRTNRALDALNEFGTQLKADAAEMAAIQGPPRPVSRMIQNPEYDAVWNRLMELGEEYRQASNQVTDARKAIRQIKASGGDVAEAQKAHLGGKIRAQSLRELQEPLRERLNRLSRYIYEYPP